MRRHRPGYDGRDMVDPLREPGGLGLPGVLGVVLVLIVAGLAASFVFGILGMVLSILTMAFGLVAGVFHVIGNIFGLIAGFFALLHALLFAPFLLVGLVIAFFLLRPRRRSSY